MNRRGFMAMVGAAICLPAMGKKKLSGTVMRKLASRGPVKRIIEARAAQFSAHTWHEPTMMRAAEQLATSRAIRNMEWTEIAVIKPESNVNPYIKEHGRIRREWEPES